MTYVSNRYIDALEIRPVGMTLERALEIATNALDATEPEDLILLDSPVSFTPRPHGGFRVAGRGVRGRPLSASQRARILAMRAAGQTVNDVAIAVGVASRTVSRVTLAAHQPAPAQIDADWATAQTRKHNLETYRHQTENKGQAA